MTADLPRLMRAATVASMAVAVVLIGAKTAAWLATESVSMLSSLVDSSLDFLASLVTFLAVRQALTPADADHRFGHGKAEALAGLTQAGFIAASGGGLLLTVGDRLLHPHQIHREAIGVAVSVLAVVLTLGLVAFQNYVVRRTGSIAIGADKAHYKTDLVSNIAVGVALYLSGRFDQPLIDAGMAALVAFYLLHGSWQVGRSSLDVLMDRELPDADRLRIVDIAKRHPEVQDIHDLRTRSSGLTRFIQLHIELDPLISLTRAHEIGDQVEADIQAAFPDAEIILHVDPFGVEERRVGFA
ncbi:MAG: cation diffusion facilitator family transporter [Reyranella sp.]|uniref:cation diffusion facilitator family transporter n=1 Tax=Reyranella sp. TaxID=1929291 RepID=UPI002731E79B|nr:cation diffusion facilitator family transporter [Reyranella sp.]MDP1965541.1 cation diffusion facilitator family transporter [Reyranella sp.]MDP2376521.1 cation diffusion facilitator family transporter [Reyranella sp.]